MLLGEAKNFSEWPSPTHQDIWYCPVWTGVVQSNLSLTISIHHPVAWLQYLSKSFFKGVRSLGQVGGRDGTEGRNGILIQTHYNRQASDHGPGSSACQTTSPRVPFPSLLEALALLSTIYLQESSCMGVAHIQIGPASEIETPAQQSFHSCQRGKNQSILKDTQFRCHS